MKRVLRNPVLVNGRIMFLSVNDSLWCQVVNRGHSMKLRLGEGGIPEKQCRRCSYSESSLRAWL